VALSYLAERDAVEDAKAALASGDRSFLVVGHPTDGLVPGIGRCAASPWHTEADYRWIVQAPMTFFEEADRPVVEKALRYMETYNRYIREH